METEMKLEELFRAIEEICFFDGSKPLLERICEMLEIHEEQEAEEELTEQNKLVKVIKTESACEQNLFYIEKSEQAINITYEKDFITYIREIQKCKKLRKFVKKYEENKEECMIVKLVSQMIGTIKKIDEKKLLSFDKEKDNAEQLADYVYKNILEKYIKKITPFCYRQIYGGNKAEEFLLELVNVIHTYLKNLGVYTIIAQIDTPYNQVLDYYESLYDKSQGSTSNPIITQIDYPAYVIDFIDEEGERQFRCLQGRCDIRKGER